MKNIAKNWKNRLLKSYSSWSIIANILVALSISGLAVLGVISNVIAVPLLVCLAIALGLVGLVGRVVDQGLDNLKERSEEDAE